MNPLYAAMPTTIFETMSARARASGAINLGQGFPDSGWPQDVLDAAATALLQGSNQYPPMPGTPELRRAIADHYRVHQDVDLDWQREVTVTSGATEALAAALLALITPGDEVILFQPLYDAYLPLVRRAGGVPVLVPLAPPHWQFDAAMLSAAFSPRTRVVLINNPLNPSASTFDRTALEMLAGFAERHDVVVIADEVWEHVVFDGAMHSSVLSVPALRHRSVKIGSAGKIFALTGWKVGWMCAAPELTHALARSHQFLTFTTPPNLQAGVAHGLGKDPGWFAAMRAGFQRSRDRLVDGLVGAGYAMLPSAGTWFVSVDLAGSAIPHGDIVVADRLLDAGVASIPVSAFYAEDAVTTTLRLCFAKHDATIDVAISRLAAARTGLSRSG
ncbi:aminotransferase [Polymorphobacter fuscus]|uniref:aspartate transaminase n=1 Tax=Sandarakinorhabdus fusca TaxID=1439888 RepID=A0A7C9GMJ5_9SPHN|nr:aminotransferase [Polymorphobacter fuscus]KAB7648436.1 aminotransferase [Polymorphobacter fuscus]MQT15955.1 aminotransferase [Polymorphobacter fuscus]NJC07769.1 aspartate/methionine/tyrosine aminotransferase [Polymorphobacter fuscus]